ncbi:MAG: FctA domain-containing protein [Clostridia bacterium]|nr:FctA domain-containing protein [Clostridia bacterium]
MKMKIMKIKKTTSVISILLLLSFVMSLFFISPVSAISGTDYSVSVNQLIKITGDGSKPQEPIKYKMTPLKENSPLPDGSSASFYNFEIRGDDSTNFTLHFDTPGLYRYSIELDKNNYKNFTFDNKKYELQVMVLETTDGLKAETQLIKDQDGYKYTDIEFKHQYSVPKKPENSIVETIKKEIPKMGVIAKTGYSLWAVTLVVLLLLLFKRKKQED